MTLVVSWIGVDTHGPASAYIVSDSRLTWADRKHFDYGRKVFASKEYPEIFGYCGDVLFPSIVLSQIIEMIDSKVLFNFSLSCLEKNKLVYTKLRHSFELYPDEYGDSPIQILHISRDTVVQGYPRFHQYIMSWSKREGWKKEEKSIPVQSGVLNIMGSGAKEFRDNYDGNYQNGINRSTSRNVFHCFIDTINNIRDEYCGGPPQLVGMYRKPLTAAQNYGILYNNRRFFLGMEVSKDSQLEEIEWRNEFFELCNGDNKRRMVNATRQPDPLRR